MILYNTRVDLDEWSNDRLIDLKAELTVAIGQISSDIENGGNRSKDWITRAQRAQSVKQNQLRLVNQVLDRRALKSGAAEIEAFYAAAHSMLPPDTVAEISAEAKRRIDNASQALTKDGAKGLGKHWRGTE